MQQMDRGAAWELPFPRFFVRTRGWPVAAGDVLVVLLPFLEIVEKDREATLDVVFEFGRLVRDLLESFHVVGIFW